MVLERKRTISAITIHFATQDILDEEGNVVVTKGTMKRPKVEWLDSIEEDGVVVDGTQRRNQASEEDVEVERDITGEALTVVRGLKKIIRDRSV